MIDIGNTGFYIPVKSLSKRDFEEYTSHLFDTWDSYIESSLKVPDYSISLEIEEGSIKGTGKIGLALTALYFGIGNYGDFISGLQTIRGQIAYVNSKLIESASTSFSNTNARTTYKNNPTTLTHLDKLFHKVQKGEMMPEEAMSEMTLFLGDEGRSSPEFMQELGTALHTVPKFPHQEILFEDETLQVPGDDLHKLKKSKPSVPIPKPEQPDNQFRVEVWRESKNEKKKVRVIKL